MVKYLWFFMIMPARIAAMESQHLGIDASTAYLSMIFGSVDGLLPGAGSQMAGHLFGILSTTLLVFASILRSYTVFVSIFNTASQGQFLGQKWSSMWIPIRVVVGFCLLVPKGVTGYSLIQIMVLSVVLQGARVADAAWEKTLSYLEKGGTIVESVGILRDKAAVAHVGGAPQDVHDEYEAQTHWVKEAGRVLKAEVCMMLGSRFAYPYSTKPATDESEGMIKLTGVANAHINWPTDGYLLYHVPHSQSYNLRKVAAEHMAYSLVQTARFIAEDMRSNALKKRSVQQASDGTQGTSDSPVPTTPSFLSKASLPRYKLTHPPKGALVNTARYVMHMLKEDARYQQYARARWDQKKNMEIVGWLSAGSFYWALAEKSRNSTQDFNWSDIRGSITVSVPDDNTLKGYLPKGRSSEYMEALNEFIHKEERGLESYYRLPWITPQFGAPEEGSSNELEIKQSEGENVSEVEDWLLDFFRRDVLIFQRSMQRTINREKDPIIALSAVGRALLDATEKIWKKVQEGTIRFPSLIVARDDNRRDEWVLKGDVEDSARKLFGFAALLPILITWMLLNFTLGSLLVYYLPLVPFLLFFFGSLSWFGSVIGAVIAAPLVAVGLTSPEGHEVFGQAEQAIRLLAGLFLRPLLMIMGLVFAMILCTVAFELFHYTYGNLVEKMPKFNGVLLGVSQIANTALYTAVSIGIVQRSFSLIYELPQRVFGWISWQVEGQSEAEMLGQLKGGLEQSVGSLGSQVTSRVVHPEQARGGNSASDVVLRNEG